MIDFDGDTIKIQIWKLLQRNTKIRRKKILQIKEAPSEIFPVGDIKEKSENAKK